MADVDVVSDILAAANRAFPDSNFIQGLAHQYLLQGSLSKRQMEGLYQKAQRIENLAPNKLATLEALIRKRPTRYKSSLPATEPLYKEDDETKKLLEEILVRYPQHKRVLFLLAKFANHQPLQASELAEARKFHKLLIK